MMKINCSVHSFDNNEFWFSFDKLSEDSIEHVQLFRNSGKTPKHYVTSLKGIMGCKNGGNRITVVDDTRHYACVNSHHRQPVFRLVSISELPYSLTCVFG